MCVSLHNIVVSFVSRDYGRFGIKIFSTQNKWDAHANMQRLIYRTRHGYQFVRYEFTSTVCLLQYTKVVYLLRTSNIKKLTLTLNAVQTEPALKNTLLYRINYKRTCVSVFESFASYHWQSIVRMEKRLGFVGLPESLQPRINRWCFCSSVSREPNTANSVVFNVLRILEAGEQ